MDYMVKKGVQCMWLCKDTNLKANHNMRVSAPYVPFSVCDSAKILIWKQITTSIAFLTHIPLVYVTLQRY